MWMDGVLRTDYEIRIWSTTSLESSTCSFNLLRLDYFVPPLEVSKKKMKNATQSISSQTEVVQP